MKVGRVIGVVGPSGVGKDSVMAGVAEAAPDFQIVQRAITRAPGLGGEDYLPVTPSAFAEHVAAGDFCLHWTAHGLSYGIPSDIQRRARDGQSFLVNLSRGVLTDADRVFPDFTVLQLSASPETLATRLAGRGRETVEEIRARLERSGKDIPSTLNVITVTNDGALEDTVAQVLTHLQRDRA